MIRSTCTAIALLLAVQAAQADCSADIRLQNSIAEQYNSLARDPACGSGAQQAVILGLLQQAVEVTARLESCETARVGTSVAELNSMVANFEKDNAEACAVIQGYEQLDRDLQEFQDAVMEEQNRLLDESKAFEDKAAELRKKIKELEEAEKKQAAAAKPPKPAKGDTSACPAAVAQMKRLAEDGHDVSDLKKTLAENGCSTD